MSDVKTAEVHDVKTEMDDAISTNQPTKKRWKIEDANIKPKKKKTRDGGSFTERFNFLQHGHWTRHGELDITLEMETRLGGVNFPV